MGVSAVVWSRGASERAIGVDTSVDARWWVIGLEENQVASTNASSLGYRESVNRSSNTND